MSFCALKSKVMSTAVEAIVARSADHRRMDGSYLAFLQSKFPGCEKVWTKIQTVTVPGRIQLAGKAKNVEIAAEMVASDFARVYRTPTMNMEALAEGFHYWICYCSRPKARKIQRAFVDLPDPYAQFNAEDFIPSEEFPLFHSVCAWQLQESPNISEHGKRCEFMKKELNNATFVQDQWDLETPMGQMKMLQFMIVCIYAHNNYKELASQPVEDKDSMPLTINLGRKRAQAEPLEEPRHERQMNPYSVLIQSTTVNVKFVGRSEGKFLTENKKSSVYKYAGSIHRKGGKEAEKFSWKTLTELRVMTGLGFASLNSKKVPENGETLYANDTLDSKLTTLTGDINEMLEQFAGEVKAEIDRVNDNVLIVGENLINGLYALRENHKVIINKLDQFKEGTLADSISFGMGNNDEVLRLTEELAKKEQIIKQKDELIALLMKQLNERK